MKASSRLTQAMTIKPVKVVGGGLAGAEATWQLIKRGIPVELYEMKPLKFSPAHELPGLCELVCSNSLKAEHLTNASGLLKAEMALLDSLVLATAQKTRVPAGGALAVDREMFSEEISSVLLKHPLVSLKREVVSEVPDTPSIIATGPLTEDSLASAIKAKTGQQSLHFFDAAAPIVTYDSLDMDKIFRQSRYGRGEGDDYLNCPMNEAEYNAFYDALLKAELTPLHDFEKKQVFEGCLAVEILASRGRLTLAFGPMKPVGLIDPRTGREPFAVVQLRQDNLSGTLYNLVGFQTRLKFGEQKRVFSMIPGLANAEFARYGVMHRNTYLDSPNLLTRNYAYAKDPMIRFAGQMTGVEGYMESTASGLVAGLSLARALKNQSEIDFSDQTIIGALEAYVRTLNHDFQPMNSNFGLLQPLPQKVRGKKNRYEQLAKRSLDIIRQIAERIQSEDNES